ALSMTATNFVPCLATYATWRPSGLRVNVSGSHIEKSTWASRVSETLPTDAGGFVGGTAVSVGASVAVAARVGDGAGRGFSDGRIGTGVAVLAGMAVAVAAGWAPGPQPA